MDKKSQKSKADLILNYLTKPIHIHIRAHAHFYSHNQSVVFN